MVDMQKTGNILLLLGGLILAIPPVAAFLARLSGYISILVGIICTIVALILLFKR